MSQSATIKSLPRAFRMMKVMQAELSAAHDLTDLCSTGVDRSWNGSNEGVVDGSGNGASRGSDHEVRGDLRTFRQRPFEV